MSKTENDFLEFPLVCHLFILQINAEAENDALLFLLTISFCFRRETCDQLKTHTE